jgi:hypothetical protein
VVKGEKNDERIKFPGSVPGPGNLFKKVGDELAP